jgi:hypothetical protein
MYRLSDELAKELIAKIKSPELESYGNTAFLPKHLNSVGIIDPICCVGSAFHYVIESPKPIIYPNLPFVATGVQAYFLYKKEELHDLTEPWEISRVFVDPTAKDPEETIDVRDVAIMLPSDIEKLTIPLVHHLNTMDELIKKEPLIIDCLNWEKKNGK